jgi:hypothetical protein
LLLIGITLAGVALAVVISLSSPAVTPVQALVSLPGG